MPFTYHPPTRTTCETCQGIDDNLTPIIDSHRGKASAADNFPFHNWYNFVLGYTPEFPDYIINKEKLTAGNYIVDPFLGSGTTMICCKLKGIDSGGVEANDFFEFAAKTKLEWNISTKILRKTQKEILSLIKNEVSHYNWEEGSKNSGKNPDEYAISNRPSELLEKYISNLPYTRLEIIRTVLDAIRWSSVDIKNFFYLAYSATILPSSNVRYGPGFGIIKAKRDVDVIGIFTKRLERMISDIENVQSLDIVKAKSSVILGDARIMSKYFKKNSIDYMITSPPYPGDHEYTKHSKLELIFNNFAHSLEEFRIIKQRMLRGSTTNIYKNDKEGELIKDIKSINEVVEEIDKRLKHDNATSGFEKLYTRLIREYFGGMHNVFTEAYQTLKPGGKFALLVSDSHAFKMVHIKTAELLKDVAEQAGYTNCKIDLWQYKVSTSHKYKLLENILTIQKPFNS